MIQKIRKFLKSKNFTLEKMKIFDIFLLLIWVPIVLLLFKFVANKNIAGLFASLGFMLISLYLLAIEIINKNKNLKKVFLHLTFLLGFAFPIFFFRFFNLEKSLDEIKIFEHTIFNNVPLIKSLTVGHLHNWSSKFYILMLFSLIALNYRDQKKRRF